MHLVAFLLDVSDDLLFICYTRLLFFDQAISNALKLGSYRIEHTIMVSNSILLFLDDHTFKFVPIRAIVNNERKTKVLHSFVVVGPSIPEK